MTLPDKALFTIPEAMDHLALSRASIYRLIEEGQLQRVHPRPRAARITRESLHALLHRSAQPGAVAASTQAGQQRAAQARAAHEQQQQERKKGLLARWGLGG